MLTMILVLINIATIIAGIYLFDYRIDGMVNNPLIIIISIISGSIIMILVLLLYIEFFYYTIAKTKPKTSMLKHKIAKQMTSIPLYFTNTKVEVIGKENLPKDPGFTIYSNHTSLMDIPLFMHIFHDYPVAFLQKQVVSGLFSIGKWTPELGCVDIDRVNTRKGAEAIIKTIKHVKSGSTMVIFPEGTRAPEVDKLLPFRDGSFKVAMKSKAPLVPISIVKSKKLQSVIWPLPRRYKVVVHQPISIDELKQTKSQELSDKVREIIQKGIDENI